VRSSNQDQRALRVDIKAIRVVSTSSDPDAVYVSEVWTDQVAHDASLETEDIRALIPEARPLITGMSEQTHLTVHGGKGASGAP